MEPRARPRRTHTGPPHAAPRSCTRTRQSARTQHRGRENIKRRLEHNAAMLVGFSRALLTCAMRSAGPGAEPRGHGWPQRSALHVRTRGGGHGASLPRAARWLRDALHGRPAAHKSVAGSAESVAPTRAAWYEVRSASRSSTVAFGAGSPFSFLPFLPFLPCRAGRERDGQRQTSRAGDSELAPPPGTAAPALGRRRDAALRRTQRRPLPPPRASPCPCHRPLRRPSSCRRRPSPSSGCPCLWWRSTRPPCPACPSPSRRRRRRPRHAA